MLGAHITVRLGLVESGHQQELSPTPEPDWGGLQEQLFNRLRTAETALQAARFFCPRVRNVERDMERIDVVASGILFQHVCASRDALQTMEETVASTLAVTRAPAVDESLWRTLQMLQTLEATLRTALDVHHRLCVLETTPLPSRNRVMIIVYYPLCVHSVDAVASTVGLLRRMPLPNSTATASPQCS
jgi:hypothetical protein